MWIYVPDSDTNVEPWVGTITRPLESGAFWHFELIRHVDAGNLHREVPFDSGNETVIALLDHQQRCTLFRPRLRHIDPGSIGIHAAALRTRISGDFDALLSGIPVSDPNEEIFINLSFSSDSLATWFDNPAYKSDLNSKTRTYSISINDTASTAFHIKNLGKFKVTIVVDVSSKGLEAFLHSKGVFFVEFEAPISLRRLADIGFGLESLFGFLIGFRGKFPIFKAQIPQRYKIGDVEIHHEGSLEISGVSWQGDAIPTRMDCVHLQNWGGGTLEVVLEKYLGNYVDLLTRINIVQFSRHFSSNLSDRFLAVMPALEEYLKARYTTPDETTYIQQEKDFFGWVESSNNENIIEFSRKHVTVQKRKSPSLKTLLDRAIKFVNQKGFEIPQATSARLHSRRSHLFHSTPDVTEEDANKFYDEVQAATFLLMLHTFDDLGIDISIFIRSYFALREFRAFLPKMEDTHPPNTAK